MIDRSNTFNNTRSCLNKLLKLHQTKALQIKPRDVQFSFLTISLQWQHTLHCIPASALEETMIFLRVSCFQHKHLNLLKSRDFYWRNKITEDIESVLKTSGKSWSSLTDHEVGVRRQKTLAESVGPSPVGALHQHIHRLHLQPVCVRKRPDLDTDTHSSIILTHTDDDVTTD